MKIFISGSSGLIGSALIKNLEADGHDIGALPRTYKSPIDFSKVDVVIHLAGESIAEGRWTHEKKKRIEDSRIIGTRQLAEQLVLSDKKPFLFISASAIGFYGDRSDEIMDEDSFRGSGYLCNVCDKWEEEARITEQVGIRTVQLRTGIVLDKSGGALKKMLLPFKLGGGGILGNGKQYMSWIGMDDMIKSIRYIIENKSITGPVNLVAPNPVTNYEFTQTLGQVLHRPTFLPLPAILARFLFGEMADALLLASTRVYPKKLTKAGYKFKHEYLRDALEDILK